MSNGADISKKIIDCYAEAIRLAQKGICSLAEGAADVLDSDNATDAARKFAAEQAVGAGHMTKLVERMSEEQAAVLDRMVADLSQ